MSIARMPVVENQDTTQARKKASIINALKRLIEDVESDNCYGEFGVTFTAQNGRIGHYEEHIKRTYK